VAADQRGPVDVGGPLKSWRSGRPRCPACGNPIVRGPVEICAGQHVLDLRVGDLRHPLSQQQRRLVERGYHDRWLFGLCALVMMGLAVLSYGLVLAGLLSSIVLTVLWPIAVILVVLALLLSPPILWRPTPEQFDRQVRAAERPAPIQEFPS
jgi:hypothetical protein